MGSVDRRLNAAATRNVALERRLSKALQGEVAFDAFTRGRYATDASIYQIMPLGVVFPRSALDISATLDIAREQDVPVIFRGGGTSQNGQPIGAGLVVDCARHFNGLSITMLQAAACACSRAWCWSGSTPACVPMGCFFRSSPPRRRVAPLAA